MINEKTPDSVGLYDPGKNQIICANHFQSPQLAGLRSNKIQIRQSASEYRYHRLEQLLSSVRQNTVTETVKILRDHRGLDNADIGMGNEKAINQMIANHSIILNPEKRWVSRSLAVWGICVLRSDSISLRGMRSNREIADSSSIYRPTFVKSRDFN